MLLKSKNLKIAKDAKTLCLAEETAKTYDSCLRAIIFIYHVAIWAITDVKIPSSEALSTLVRNFSIYKNVTSI